MLQYIRFICCGFLFFIGTTLVNAQVGFVFRTGFGTTNYSSSNHDLYPKVEFNAKTNWQYGLSFDIGLSAKEPAISLTQEVIFDIKKYESSDEFNNSSQDVFRMSYLSFPFIIKGQAFANLQGLLGISPGFMTGNNYKHADRDQSPYKRHLLDLLIGMECNIKNKIALSARYSHSLVNSLDFQAIDKDGDFYQFEAMKYRTVYIGIKIFMNDEKINLQK